MTYGMTHEMVEAITDPLLNGWVRDTGGGNLDEIADQCSTNFTVNGVICSGYFSNEDNACIAPAALKPTWLSCASDFIYDAPTQTCKKTTTGTGTTNTGTTANTTLKTQVQNAITSIFQSNYFTGMMQYGLAKKPTIGSFTVNSTVLLLPDKYTKAQLEAIINDSITKNQVPAASATRKNLVYFVLTPPNIKYGPTQSTGLNYAIAGDTGATFYKIIGSATQINNFDDFTQTISFIAANIVSEQVAPKGYHLKSSTGNATIDAKVTQYGPALPAVCFGDNTNNKINNNTIAVAKYWSDQDGACIIPAASTNPTPWLTCHTGAVYDSATQSCKLQPTSGGGGTTPPGTGGGQGYKIFEAVATDDDGHVPANAIDGKLDTRWSAFGKGQYLRLDLATDATPTPKKVNKVKIAWYQGDKRTNTFEITTAEVKGGSYTSQLKATSTKGSAALQDYTINPANPIRYIRIIVNGNSDNDWASISEVEVWGPDVASTTPGTGTGGDPGSGGTTPGGDTGGGTGTVHPQPDTPITEAGYNFFDTSFSVDYHKIGLCNPVE